MNHTVKAHYNPSNLVVKIQQGLKQAGKSLEKLQSKDLSLLDQLHTGGAKATISLLKKTHPKPGDQVLDAGCGIGGSSRLMVELFGCQVTGVDISEMFIDTADFLTRHTHLEHQVQFQTASLLDMPFEDHSFDLILCQHVLMNLQDKETVIRDFFRILKPGGKLVLHEITQGSHMEPFLLPVPWASSKDISFLVSWEQLSQILSSGGFHSIFFENQSNAALEWWQLAKKITAKRKFNPNALGPGLIFGDNARFFPQNMAHNFQLDCIRLYEAVFQKTADSHMQ